MLNDKLFKPTPPQINRDDYWYGESDAEKYVPELIETLNVSA